MNPRLALLAICSVLWTTSAAAQTNVTNSNNGTTNVVPVYTGSATLGNSPISVSGSNVGIGTPAPGYNFHVFGPGGASFATDVSQSPANPVTMVITATPTSSSSSKNETFTWYANEDSNWVKNRALNLYQYPSDSLGGCCHWHAAFGIDSSGNNYQFFSGNMGIGTSVPGYMLDVLGQIHASSGFVFPDGSVQTTAYSQQGIFQVGNGNTNVVQALYVDSNLNGNIVSAPTQGVWIEWNSMKGMTDFVNNEGGGTGGWQFINTNASGTPTSTPMTIEGGGNVGIGTTTPSYMLDVSGPIRSSAGGVVFPDGTTQTTAFIPANCGADFAESVGVTGSPKKYEPGDLLVIDPNKPGKFLKSAEPYSPMVAGIYSTKPGFVGRLHPASDPASADEVPMAMVGRVPTKVTSENGPIKVGDLLVASSTPGYAMKGTDRNKMLGAVVGKALEPLDSGTGVITVLVTLQ